MNEPRQPNYEFYCDTCGESWALDPEYPDQTIQENATLQHRAPDGTLHTIRRITKQ